MGVGILEVLLMNAKGLESNDFIGNLTCCGLAEKFDPYVLIEYKTQEHKSSAVRGGNPLWNEKFLFRVEYPGDGDSHHKLTLKIMDQRHVFLGRLRRFRIIVEDLTALGAENGTAELHPMKYQVVKMDEYYRGEIQVGIKFSLRTRKTKKGWDAK